MPRPSLFSFFLFNPNMSPTPSFPLSQLPLGFRFHPTDEELINHYLKRKINGRIKPCDAAAVPEIDVCRFEPWDLPDKSPIKSSDPEWFFFAAVDRKYPSGNRSNRATEAGYWKATGTDRQIRSRIAGGGGAVVVGMKKTLVFHRGRAPKGTRTNWIMHEYRTVEPEFDSGGDQGGFVLCRLFRKPEETVSGIINDETENVSSCVTASRSSPASTLHRENGLKEEFATPLNQQLSPEPVLQKGIHPLPDAINNQSADNKLASEAYCWIPYPLKSEESHCSSSNMPTDAGDQMHETAVEEGAPLYDDLKGFLGHEFEHLFSDEFPSAVSTFNYDFYEEGHTQFQYPKLEQDSVTKVLDVMLSAPEEYSADVSSYQTGPATKFAPQDQTVMIEQGSTSNSVTSRDVDSEALLQQHAKSALLIGSSGSLQRGDYNPSDVIDPSMEVMLRNGMMGMKRLSSAPAKVTGTDFNVRPRYLINSENQLDFTAQQGTADRRSRLQSLNSEERIQGGARREKLLASVTTIAEATKDLIGEMRDVSVIPFLEPPPLDDDELFSTDHGGAEFKPALSSEEPEEPSLRLRTRQTHEADIKLESSSLHQENPKLKSVSTCKVGIAALAIVSVLCAGTVWLLNS